jgi:hypothetical protein
MSALNRGYGRLTLALATLFTASMIAIAPLGSATSPAGAAGYPPPVTNTSCSVSVVIPISTSATITFSCAFAPGSPASVDLNGSVYGTFTADPTSGLLTLVLAATDPHLSIDGGAMVSADLNPNTITATGLNSSGGTNTATALVQITAAGGSLSTTGNNNGGALGNGNGATGTGSSGATPAAAQTTAKTTGSAGGSLAFTGADILATIIAALILLALGTLLVVFARRRAGRGAAPTL